MSRLDPVARIDLFTARIREFCAEAELPEFDEVAYDERQEALAFVWHMPPFCMAVPLRSASLFGMGADDLLAAWQAKHGGDWRARLARGAIRPRDERAA